MHQPEYKIFDYHKVLDNTSLTSWQKNVKSQNKKVSRPSITDKNTIRELYSVQKPYETIRIDWYLIPFD